MLTLNFSPFPTLTTENLILRQITADDDNEVFIIRSDEGLMKYIDRPPAKLKAEAVEFIENITTYIKNNESIMWAISFKNDPKLIGTICFWNIKKEDFRAEIGFILLPEYHGKGIMDEALRAVIDFGFNTMKLHSIEGNVNPENKASIKLMERNNFVREAYFKDHYFYEGKFLDTAIYSLLSPVV